MRWSLLQQRELLNVADGNRMGRLHQVDLMINEETGTIEEIIIPVRKTWLNFFRKPEVTRVPWRNVRRVGTDFILLDQGDSDG